MLLGLVLHAERITKKEGRYQLPMVAGVSKETRNSASDQGSVLAYQTGKVRLLTWTWNSSISFSVSSKVNS